MSTNRTTEPQNKRGPKTQEGKLRSSLNALKHGLTAKSPQAFELMRETCPDTYEQVLDKMRAHYFPRDPIEDELCQRIARCLWRLKMTSGMEGRIIERNPGISGPGVSYERIMRFERSVDIHLHRAIAALNKKREAENKNNAQNENHPRSS